MCGGALASKREFGGASRDPRSGHTLEIGLLFRTKAMTTYAENCSLCGYFSRSELDSGSMHTLDTGRLSYSHMDLRLLANCSRFDLANNNYQ
jgi:hypothetical protein